MMMKRTKVAGVLVAFVVSLAAPSAAPVTASPATPERTGLHGHGEQPELPAPPRPDRKPLPPPQKKYSADAGGTTSPSAASSAKTASMPDNGAKGSNSKMATLVLYDSTGPWSWLGEAYGVQTANLVSHSSRYTLRPVATYTAGLLGSYTSVVYVGSTFDEQLPAAFLTDVLATTKPVLWMNYNIWQLAQASPDFVGRFGFSYSFFDFGAKTTVTYKATTLQRDPLAADSGLLAVEVTDPAKAAVLATASGDGGSLPWAVRSGNLTYVAEVPFSYVGSADRYLAVADLISATVDPQQTDERRALARIEDVGPDTDPADIRAIADYLSSQKVPFTMAVYARYEDPNGVNSGGVPTTITLKERPQLVEALKYAKKKNGTILLHGYTHQFGSAPNPYDGTSGNDFEFFTAHVDANDRVIYDGPVPGDSRAWATDRIKAGAKGIEDAGLGKPTIFEPPHYAASAVDYQAIASLYSTRYDRGLYFAGWCPGGACGTGTPDYSRIYGQFFPYLVRDIYGSAVVPESIGNIEPEAYNHHPARFPADLIASARALSVVRGGVASFYYHPYLGTAYLKELVPGIKQLGYKFVAAGDVAGG